MNNQSSHSYKKLFDPNQNPYTVFTSKTDAKITDFCNKVEAGLWQAGDINLTFDAEQWNTHMTQTERDYIKQIIAFFASSDGLVNENIVLSFITKVKIPEVKYFYYYQMLQEAVHSKTYSNLITTFIKDTQEQETLFDSINSHPIIKKKAEWCQKWMGGDKNFFEILVAFLAVEGIFFSSSFASIFWLRDRGILANSLGVANEWISKDEAAHAEFASFLIKEYGQNDINITNVTNIIKEAVYLEKEFVDTILPENLIGMNKELMKQYVEYVADVWLYDLIGVKLYNVDQPFAFMETIGQKSKDNFFEKTRTNYAHPTTTIDNTYSFDLDD